MTGRASPRTVTQEARLLKAPARDYMNAAQLDFFRDRLTAMRDELLENARLTGDRLKDIEIGADVNDRATLEEERALELRTRDRERRERQFSG